MRAIHGECRAFVRVRSFVRVASFASLAWLAAAAATSTYAATPEGTVAALLLQVAGPGDVNPGSINGSGFSCNLQQSNAAFEVPDFPEATPCLKFYSESNVAITLFVSARAGFVFTGWSRDCSGTDPVLHLTSGTFAFDGIGTVPNCIANFDELPEPDQCVEPGGEGSNLADCPSDEDDCPEGAIKGTEEDDPDLVGTEAADIICGLGGNDTISGLGGNDVILGGFGADTIDAGEGDDTVVGGPGLDVILGRAGVDLIDGSDGPDRIDGGTGGDILMGGSGGDAILGNSGHDSIFGLDGPDTIIGGPGDDQLDGNAGSDTIFGCGGSDKVNGNYGFDTIRGDVADQANECAEGAGDPDGGNTAPAKDVLIGGAGEDHLFGDGGPDVLRGRVGPDELNGGTGADVLFAGPGDDFLEGGLGNDILFGATGNDGFVMIDGVRDVAFGGDDCDAAASLFDAGLDTLDSIEEPDSVCIVPLP